MNLSQRIAAVKAANAKPSPTQEWLRRREAGTLPAKEITR